MNAPTPTPTPTPKTDPNDDLLAERDRAIVTSSTYATQSLIGGLLGLLLAPIVVGFIPAAIGLHAAGTHLRYRQGHRLRVWSGLLLSGAAAIGSAGASIAWGAILLSILLQRSAIDQARQWEGLQLTTWRFDCLGGEWFTSESTRGRLVYIDVCSTQSPFSPGATQTLAAFKAKHPEITVLSWCPACDETSGLAYIRDTAKVSLPIAVGEQSLPEPFSLMSATPSLVVVDPMGVIRTVHPGTYTEKELEAIIDAPTPKAKSFLGRESGH